MKETSTSDHDSTNAGETAGAALEMVLWTRRPVCGPRTAVIDQLSSLAASDDIGGFHVETWPDELAMSEHTEHTRVVERYKEFLLWAEENDCSITPPFERRTVSPLIGKRRDVLTLPIMCLAVYEDDTLCGVYPHSDDGDTISVTDYLTTCVDTETVVRSDTTVSVDP